MNWPSVIILAVILAALVAIIAAGIIRKRNGKSSCSCGGACGACPMGESCHQRENLTTK